MTITTRLAGLALGTALSIPLALGVTSLPADTVPTAEAAQQAQPDYQPGTDLEPYCQWEYYKGKVNVFGPDATRYRVKLRGPKERGYRVLTNTSGTFKVGRAQGYAEDDIVTVSCKIDGRWRVAEPA